MQRYVLAGLALLALLTACGGGDKPRQRDSGDDRRPQATETVAADEPARTPETEPTADEPSSDGGDGSLSGVFSSLFGAGLGGGGPRETGAGDGDESLKQYLPDASDLPPGFTSLGEYTFSSPDGISTSGAIDVAALMAMRGDEPADPPSMDLGEFEMLMVMVLKPEDLADLGSALDDIKDLDEEEIRREFEQGTGGLEGFELREFDVFEVADLGDGGFGMQMSMDMSALSEMISVFGGEDAPDLSTITMRMYIFGEGEHAGAVMRMAFTDTLADDGAELALAQAIDAKLKAAP